MQVHRLAMFLATSLAVCQGFCPLTQGPVSFSRSGHLVSGFAKSEISTLSQRQMSIRLNLAGAQEAWSAYNDALQANPLLVKSVTAGVILGAGDLAGQALEASQKEGGDSQVDLARTVRFAFFGLVLQAPWNHFYYLLLDGAIPPTEDPWTATTGIKVVIDQFIQAPIFTVLIFAFLGFLEGKSTSDIKQKLDEDYVNTMFANCK